MSGHESPDHPPRPRAEAAPAQAEPAHVEHDFTGPLSEPVARLLKVFGALCVLLFALDFVVTRKTHAPGEQIPGFYAIYGFAGCVLLVLVAKEMRKVVMRREDYYERTDEQVRQDARERGGPR